MTTENKITHRELCEIGSKILKTKLKCTVSIHEPKGIKENPDAIGWRYGYGGVEYEGSILLEAKTSHADFKNDFKKAFRINAHDGIGNWRFYICPTDVIKVEELPEKWGLIYVDDKRRTKIIVNPYETRATRRKNKFTDFNIENERFLLTRWLNRTENPEKIAMILRETNNKFNRACNQIEDLKEENRQYAKYRRLIHKYKDLTYKELSHDEFVSEIERLREIETYLSLYKSNPCDRTLNRLISLVDD
jgi:hypothetical protein